jgi:hypothetical protein
VKPGDTEKSVKITLSEQNKSWRGIPAHLGYFAQIGPLFAPLRGTPPRREVASITHLFVFSRTSSIKSAENREQLSERRTLSSVELLSQ